jgi:hypothetical protein
MKLSTKQLKLSPPTIDILLGLYRKGTITNSKSGLYRMTFYPIIWYLKDRGIVKCNGVEGKNEKIWILTDKGKQVAFHLCEILKIFNGDIL